MGGALLTGNRAMDEVPGIITRHLARAAGVPSTALVFSELLLARCARTPPCRRLVAPQLDIEAAASTKSLSSGGAAQRRRVRGGGLSVASSSEEMKALAEALAPPPKATTRRPCCGGAVAVARRDGQKSRARNARGQRHGHEDRHGGVRNALAGGAIERDLDLSWRTLYENASPTLPSSSSATASSRTTRTRGRRPRAHGDDDDDERVAPSDADRDRDIAEELAHKVAATTGHPGHTRQP